MGICVSCRRRERKGPEKRAPFGLKGAAAELLPRRDIMANSMSNIKMTNPIKGIVSKRRKRYMKDGFNLDLAYITDRLIAMGFPAENLEGVYRNHIDEVARFLELKHRDHYKIYNLCSERSYDHTKFHERVVRYAFDDHTPPNIELIIPFCEDVHSWLSADSRNVAAVHCKAGKGRTGTMVCCYLLYSGQKATADEALQFYGTKRTHDEKGVTIPSQRRYVEYYAALIRSGLTYTATKVHIRELIMTPPPELNGSCTIEITVTQAKPPLKFTPQPPQGCHEIRKHANQTRVILNQCTPLCGDVRVNVYTKPKIMMRKEKLFQFWFNTFFVANCVGSVRVPPLADSVNLETFKLTLNKWQLDVAHKDKQNKAFSPEFKVELIVQKQPESSKFSAHGERAPSPPSSSDSSCSEPDTEPDAHWDSGERRYRPLQDRCQCQIDPENTCHSRDPSHRCYSPLQDSFHYQTHQRICHKRSTCHKCGDSCDLETDTCRKCRDTCRCQIISHEFQDAETCQRDNGHKKCHSDRASDLGQFSNICHESDYKSVVSSEISQVMCDSTFKSDNVAKLDVDSKVNKYVKDTCHNYSYIGTSGKHPKNNAGVKLKDYTEDSSEESSELLIVDEKFDEYPYSRLRELCQCKKMTEDHTDDRYADNSIIELCSPRHDKINQDNSTKYMIQKTSTEHFSSCSTIQQSAKDEVKDTNRHKLNSPTEIAKSKPKDSMSGCSDNQMKKPALYGKSISTDKDNYLKTSISGGKKHTDGYMSMKPSGSQMRPKLGTVKSRSVDNYTVEAMCAKHEEPIFTDKDNYTTLRSVKKSNIDTYIVCDSPEDNLRVCNATLASYVDRLEPSEGYTRDMSEENAKMYAEAVKDSSGKEFIRFSETETVTETQDVVYRNKISESNEEYYLLTGPMSLPDEYVPQPETSNSKSKKKTSKRDESKPSEKGKIPKVSSDHTISDDTKKKYTFFQKKEKEKTNDDDGGRPRLSLGDMRASWREFSGKWAEHRKKKDREDS